MQSKMLSYLPSPLAGKSGWPWTKESKRIPPRMPNGDPWPKISIVTPSYNQGRFLEETIRSVLLQNYPNLEYIIIDGCSSDNSVDIIKKYEQWLSYWSSEKDNGQADAIFKGFEIATGEIFAWLNSDDYLLADAFGKIANAFILYGDTELLIGGGIVVDEKGNLIRKYYSFPQSFNSMLEGGQFFMQMSSFWKRQAYQAVGGIDTSLRFCFDYDLFLRLAKRNIPRGIEAMLSAFRIHDKSKTSIIWEDIALPEIDAIKLRYGFDSLPCEMRKQLSEKTIHNFYMKTRHGIFCDLLRDPCYFLKCLTNKIKGKPGSSLLDLNSNRLQ